MVFLCQNSPDSYGTPRFAVAERKEDLKRSLPKRVMKEVDEAVAGFFRDLRLLGKVPTEENVAYGVSVVKQSPAYAAIARAVEKGCDGDLQKAIEIVREKLFAGARKQLLEAVKDLPHPKGGRPKMLSEEQRAEACREIGKLMGEGYDLKDSVSCMALRFGVSARTIHRVWHERIKKK